LSFCLDRDDDYILDNTTDTTAPLQSLDTTAVEDIDEDDSDYLLDPSLLTEATLPISNISRLMKKALPKQAKISSSSKELIQSCCIEFISFLTSEANEKCLSEKRKTINGDDILYAMKNLGFEEFEVVCRIWLTRYRMVSLSFSMFFYILLTTI
jgi:histone H3/H4